MNKTIVRVFGLYRHYLYSMKRNPARIIEILIWPAFEVALFAMLVSSQNSKSYETKTITVIILTGIVYWNCTARIIQETVAQLIDDFASKNIQSMLIAPVSLGELLFSITAASITKIILSLSALGAVLFFVYPAFFTQIGPPVILWVLQLELLGVSLSFIAIAIVFVLGERASFVGWLISTVLQIFSLIFYDRSALPILLRQISYFVPSSYVFESIHAYTKGSPISINGQVYAFALSILYMILGSLLISLAFHWAKRIGTFTRI